MDDFAKCDESCFPVVSDCFWFQSHWMFRQGKYLKQTSVKSNQVFFDQPIPSIDVFIHIEFQNIADSVVTIIRETFAIRYQHQEDIKQQLMMVQAFPKTIAQKAMLNKGETSVDSAYSSRIECLLYNHASSSKADQVTF